MSPTDGPHLPESTFDASASPGQDRDRAFESQADGDDEGVIGARADGVPPDPEYGDAQHAQIHDATR